MFSANSKMYILAHSLAQCEGSNTQKQGGHGTGKTGNLVLTFSRQGKHREFCFNTGKNFETQGKYFSVTQGKNLDTGEISYCDY